MTTLDPRDAEIAALKAEVSEARRHAVGVMAAGFNRALDEAGAPPAESPGLRIYAMRAEIAQLKAEVRSLDDLLVAERTSRNKVMAEKVALHERWQKDIARLTRALAAGPAALRALRSDDYSPGYVAGVVEAAQEAAMKEGE